MTGLAGRDCQPVGGVPLAGAELVELPAWSVVDATLQRQSGFDDDARMMGLVNAVAWLAQREDHHPDIRIARGRRTVRWSTHPVAGLSINDFVCAARVDALLP